MNKQIPIVVALIRDQDGHVLIARRNDPDVPQIHDKWELVGGKIEFTEDPEDAIIREVKEETGLDVEVIGMVQKIITRIWHRGDEIHQVFLLPYICKIVGGHLHDSEFDHRISELKFIHPDERTHYDYIGPREEELIVLSLNFNS